MSIFVSIYILYSRAKIPFIHLLLVCPYLSPSSLIFTLLPLSLKLQNHSWHCTNNHAWPGHPSPFASHASFVPGLSSLTLAFYHFSWSSMSYGPSSLTLILLILNSDMQNLRCPSPVTWVHECHTQNLRRHRNTHVLTRSPEPMHVVASIWA
jgi:hypothetical protein